MTDSPTIRPATPADLDTLVDLFRATRKWLAEMGSDQWATNPPERVRGRLADAISRGECYVAEEDGRVIGTITVDDFADPEFWSAEDKPETALYVHRMMVERSAAGRDVGGLLLDYAEAVAAKAGKVWLRLDAWRTNEPLHRYYVRKSFRPVRVINLAHRGSGALFQRTAI
ncbi:GNAT family N-acetyltransferase [Mangrovihabitans endophyticus]|uniref:N-acetyltransferase n=1 Tax=Mangrovihabitans endophyticus TaxID=1751298 RepID=A0A8J3FPI5_9ACTN|nr:GNAT family N-acetyltransferase [Mangrovihabitans endophyticus]GGK93149.1 N-acetyltransferase [Mangrovihabitans endophyticus]